MLIYPPGSDTPLRGDLMVRTVFRSDLTPIPQSIEFEVRDTIDSAKIKTGAIVRFGSELTEFVIVKESSGGEDGRTQGDRTVTGRQFVGLLASCAPVASATQRSVVRYGATLGEIYRACGAQIRIDSDFSVPVFACYKGMVPTFELAKALHEEAGSLVINKGRLSFIRLDDMAAVPVALTLRDDSAPSIRSEFLERHLVPFAFSTSASGGFTIGKSESGRWAVYRPRSPARILNNLSTALILRRKLQIAYTPGILAGMRVDIAQKPYTVITAAHVFEAGGNGAEGDQLTQLWLGEVVK